jgi:hypothetical protein
MIAIPKSYIFYFQSHFFSTNHLYRGFNPLALAQFLVLLTTQAAPKMLIASKLDKIDPKIATKFLNFINVGSFFKMVGKIDTLTDS